MERLAINELLKWKNKQYRKPLIVEGARQVGKTWLVKEFARQNYKQLAYVNFEEMKILQNLFEQDFNIHRILTAIGAATDVTCTEGETLIFLDEIQAAPHAVTSLKYFAENAPGYHVIAAGSLLGIELHQGESFPVGKVEFLPLYPMNFIEFVMAMGEKNLAQLLQMKDWNMITMFAPKFQELRGRRPRLEQRRFRDTCHRGNEEHPCKNDFLRRFQLQHLIPHPRKRQEAGFAELEQQPV